MREDNVHKLEVHVAGVCLDGYKVLVLKRSDSRSIFPGYWECGGGQVEVGETFEDAIKRQLREEAGVIIDPVKVVSTYEILVDNDQKKIPGLTFACKIISYVNGSEPMISEEHTAWKWQPIDKLDEIKLIPGLEGRIVQAYS